MMPWIIEVVETLERTYREDEERRKEAEGVLAVLREHPEGL